MNKNEKYLKPLQEIAHVHFETVKSQMLTLEIVKLMLHGTKKISINQEQWKLLGEPPLPKSGQDYLLDLSNDTIRNILWMKSCYDAINLGLYASTDISDSINQINNDNIDGILTDREAMLAVGQVVVAGIDGFKRMKALVDVEMSNA